MLQQSAMLFDNTTTNTTGQLSLLPCVGREMSTSQSAMMPCGWGVKASMAHSMWINVWVALGR